MEYHFAVGDKLIVKLITGEIFKGSYVFGTKDRIDLINCVIEDQIRDPDEKPFGKLSFYRADIRDVVLIDKPSNSVEDTEEEPENKVVKITQCEYQRLTAMTRNFIYMATVDSRFNDAISNLLNCESVAVICLPSKAGRGNPIDLLVMCSWDQAYLFDITIYNKKTLDKGLIEIFESTNIKKVVHDSRNLVESMYHNYDVQVKNIFDTFVADYIITGNDSRSLAECLTYYLNFPESFLYKESKFINWKERPLTTSTKIIAAQLATYLITLKNFEETEMLKDFYKKVKEHSTSTINVSPVDAHSALSKLKIC